MKKAYHIAVLVSGLSLFGCGGGGGGGGDGAPAAPSISVSAASPTQLSIRWTSVETATSYKLWRSNDDVTDYRQLGGELTATTTEATDDIGARRHDDWFSGWYLLQACNEVGCTDSTAVHASNGFPMFFAANDGSNGTELWTTDGTPEGTHLLKDINPGFGSSLYLSSTFLDTTIFTAFNGAIYFTANDTDHGHELWKTDGTEAGTVLVADLNPGTAGSSPANLTAFNGFLYFTATHADHGAELWKTDGTAANTVLVKDIVAGSTGSAPGNLVAANDTLYFVATDTDHGREVWKTDGTEAGTELVADIMEGGVGSAPGELTLVNDTLYFAATIDGLGGRELWKSDGTAAGTTNVTNVYSTGPGENGSPQGLTAFNGALYFSLYEGMMGNGRELWKSDSTGTSQVKDIAPGYAHSHPRGFTVLNGALYFFATVGSTTGLWKTDGTEAGTAKVAPVSGWVTDMSAHNNALYFTAYDGTHGLEPWTSDGTAVGTTILKDILPGLGSSLPDDNYRRYTSFKGKLYFGAYEYTYGIEIWKSDGTESNTTRLKDINPGRGDGVGYYIGT